MGPKLKISYISLINNFEGKVIFEGFLALSYQPNMKTVLKRWRNAYLHSGVTGITTILVASSDSLKFKLSIDSQGLEERTLHRLVHVLLKKQECVKHLLPLGSFHILQKALEKLGNLSNLLLNLYYCSSSVEITQN